MTLDALFELLHAAHKSCGHRHYVVIGSLSVLGMSQVADIPQDMTLSIDADCYTRDDPPRVFDLADSLGENSGFRRSHGYYLDPVSPKLPTLPDGWESRLVVVEQDGVCAHFLEPNDAAISKLARAEPRDLRWVKAGVKSGLVSVAALRLRWRQTRFFDDEEKARAQGQIEAVARSRQRS